MKNLRTTAAATLLSLLAGATWAQATEPAATPATPRVDARQAIQEQRIEAGEQKGTLTRREQRRQAQPSAPEVKGVALGANSRALAG